MINPISRFVWGKDARIEMRGPNIYIFLLKPDLVWSIAATGPKPRWVHPKDMALPVRRIKHQEVWYRIMWAVYPHQIPSELTPGHVDLAGIFEPQPQEIHIDPQVAEDMIRNGVLIMKEPASYSEQDLFWKKDLWYQQNIAGTFTPQMP